MVRPEARLRILADRVKTKEQLEELHAELKRLTDESTRLLKRHEVLTKEFQFSSEGQLLKTRTLALDSFHPDYNPKLTIYDRWDLGSNPSGDILLASLHRSGAPAPEEHWLSPETLEDIQVETADTAHCCQAMGREQVVYGVSAPRLTPVFVRSKGRQPHPLCTKCFGREAAFLDDQWVVLAGVPGRHFLIASTGGEIKVDETLGKKDDLIVGISVAPIARQIAFVLIPEHLKSTPGNFLVCIYDTALKQVTFQIQIPERIRRDPPWTEVYSGAPAVALSPDGKSLAILDDSMLRIYAMSP